MLKRRLGRIAEDIDNYNRWVLIDRLNEYGVRVETGAKTEEITESGVWITWPSGIREFFEADTVVLAAGMRPVNELSLELEGKVPELYRVGDCVQPRRVKDAIAEGFQAGFAV